MERAKWEIEAEKGLKQSIKNCNTAAKVLDWYAFAVMHHYSAETLHSTRNAAIKRLFKLATKAIEDSSNN